MCLHAHTCSSARSRSQGLLGDLHSVSGSMSPLDPHSSPPAAWPTDALDWKLFTNGMVRLPWREPLDSTAPPRLGVTGSGGGRTCGFLQLAREKPVSRTRPLANCHAWSLTQAHPRGQDPREPQQLVQLLNFTHRETEV